VVDVFPADEASVFRPLMEQLGYNPDNTSMDTHSPSGVGNVACGAVLQFRHRDGSNQLGDLSSDGVPYADYTGYKAVNPPSTVPVDPTTVADPNRWQPLQYFDDTHTFITQPFVGAQWYLVVLFALQSGDEFRADLAFFGPAIYGSSAFLEQVDELVAISANLTDEQKMIAEYFADGPHSELPPGHWDLFAQFVSARDHHGVNEDAKLFFALTNAIFDAGIVAWDAKHAFDSVRPVTAIPYTLQGQQIRAWGGPFRGTQTIPGEQWQAYQTGAQPTPAFPEFSSGHSAFSAAGAEILKSFTGSDVFGNSATIKAGSSGVEPGAVPAADVTLTWPTFTDAANQAGMSRRYGGIHFKEGDLQSRAMGRLVAAQAWAKAQAYFAGSL